MWRDSYSRSSDLDLGSWQLSCRAETVHLLFEDCPSFQFDPLLPQRKPNVWISSQINSNPGPSGVWGESLMSLEALCVSVLEFPEVCFYQLSLFAELYPRYAYKHSFLTSLSRGSKSWHCSINCPVLKCWLEARLLCFWSTSLLRHMGKQ